MKKTNTKNTLIGVDIAEKRLQEAHSKSAYTSCVQADAYHLPFCNDYFDIVISSGMVGLTGNRSLDEMHRIVKPGGYIACAIAEIKGFKWCEERFEKAIHYFNTLPNSRVIVYEDLGTGYTSDYNGEHFVLYILKCY